MAKRKKKGKYKTKKKSTQFNELKCKCFYCLGSTLVEKDWSSIEYCKLKQVVKSVLFWKIQTPCSL